MATHRWTCPTCGREVVGTAAWQARRRQPCLACTREANGWQHAATCTDSPDHRGPCVVVDDLADLEVRTDAVSVACDCSGAGHCAACCWCDAHGPRVRDL